MNLKQQRIIVTRPAQQSAGLIQQLTAAGAEPLSLPLLEIDSQHPSLNQQTLKSRFLDLDLYQHVIFVSANAARLGEQWIDQYWPQLPVGIHWLAVGEATSRTLTELDIPVSNSGTGMNSESLLSLPELQYMENQRVLICRGSGGRELIAEELTRRGARVDYAELYVRVPAQHSKTELTQLLIENAPTAILISSGQGLEVLDTQIHQQLEAVDLQQIHNYPLVVPSARIAELAKSLGYNNVSQADNATDQAMISALAACATH